MADYGSEKTAARILIVEDEAILSEDLGSSLESLGYVVSGKVSTGEEAVELAEKLRPDLILMDIKLQGDIDGIEAADQIRMDLDIPVVYLTGYSENDVLERAKKTEPYGYIGKPISVMELRNTIETAIHKHKADKRVRESEERLRLAMEATNDGVWDWEISTGETYYSPGYFLMLGLEPGEYPEHFRSWLDLIHPEDRDHSWNVNQECVQGKMETFEVEFRMRHKDGSWRWILGRGKSIARNSDGRSIRLVGTHTDITERKKAEGALRTARDDLEQRVADRTKELVAITEALKASQSTLRLITDSLPVLISYVDSEQRYRFCNKTYELWREVPREEIEGRHLQEVLGEDAYEEAREYVEAALSGSPVNYEMAVTYPDGKDRRLQVIYVPHLDEARETRGFAGLITDITERKNMEDALRKSTEELEQRVMERTAEIATVNEELKMEIARRKNTEEALRKEKEKAERYLDVAGVIIVTLDSEGRVTLINRKGCELLGYPLDEIIGTQWFDTFVAESDRDRTKAVFFQIMAGEIKAAEYFENLVLTQSGQERLIAWHNTLLTDDDGAIVGTLSSGEDITERKKIEEASRRSEERFRSLIDQAADAIFVHDLNGEFLEVNQQASKSLGYARAELLLMSVNDIDPDIVHRGDSAKYWLNLPATFEAIHRRKDGTTFPVEIRLGPIEYGETKVVLAMVRDITDRKMTEKALQENEDRCRTIFQTSPDAISITRLSDRVYVEINDSFTELTGFTRDEVIGKTTVAINIWNDPSDRDRLVAELREREQVTNLEAQFRLKDGRVRTGLMSARTLYLNGEPHVLSVTRDVEDWQKAEEELRQKTSLLNSLIEALPDSVYFKDINRRHLLTNKAYEDFFGLSRQEAVGKTIEELVTSNNVEQSRESDEAVIETKQSVVQEHCWFDERREKHIFETRKFPILDAQRDFLAIGGISRDITERKRLEENLRGSEVRLLDLYENAPNAYFSVGTDGLIRKCNRGAEELLGYPREMLEGKRVLDLYIDGPEGKEKAAKVFQKFISGEQVTSEELQMQKADGSPVWINLSVNALRDAEGQVVESRSIVVDISERKKAEEALRHSEERFQLFMQNFPGLAYIKDAEGRVLFANNGFGQYLGLDPSTMIGKTNDELFPADFAEKITTDDSRILESGEWQQIEEAYGGHFWSTHKFLIPRTGEKPLLGGFTVDISARKQAENSLRESEEQYRALVETTDTGYVVLDEQGKVLDANSEYVRLTGYGVVDEIRGRSVVEWTAEHDRERNAREVEKCFKKGFVRNLEIDYVVRMGNVIPIEINATLVRVKGHSQIVTLCRDITERKKAETQLKASLAEKEVLLREIHHRVKNNLAVMQSLLRIQSHHVKNAELTRILEETQHRIRSMALGHELLYQSENLSDINISQYLDNLLHHLMASFSIMGKRIEIKQEIEEAHLSIDTSVPLGFILTELISNCYQHAFPEGRYGEIAVSLRFLGDDHLELVVKDNGIGLPEDMDVEKPKSLGYHLMRIFVKQLRGKIEILSEKGTEVRIKFAGR
jgi:PAS domain S-box-containing protein